MILAGTLVVLAATIGSLLVLWARCTSEAVMREGAQKRLAETDSQLREARDHNEQLADDLRAALLLQSDLTVRVEELTERNLALEAEATSATQRADQADIRLDSLLADARAERAELLDRFVTQGAPQALSATGDVPSRKLHYSEQDELDGMAPGQVAAQADVDEAVRYIDELAVREGAPLEP